MTRSNQASAQGAGPTSIKKGVAKEEDVLVQQQSKSLKGMSEIAERVSHQIPTLVKWFFATMVVGNLMGFGAILLWNCASDGSDFCSGVVEHLRYFTIATVSAIAVIVSSCVIGSRSIFAALLKKMQAEKGE